MNQELIFESETRGFNEALGFDRNTYFRLSLFQTYYNNNNELKRGMINLNLEFSGRTNSDSCTKITIIGINKSQINKMIDMLTEAKESISEHDS